MVRKVALPSCAEKENTVSHSSCRCVEGMFAEIGAILKNLKVAEVVLPIVFPFNLSVWLLQKSKGY